MDRARTGLPGLVEFQAAVLSAMEDHPGEVVVLLVDVSQLLTTNLGQGWLAGNALIEGQARRLAGILREPLWHLGADMFAALLKGAPPPDLLSQAEEVTSRIERELAEPLAYDDDVLHSGADVWSIVPEPGDSIESLFVRIHSIEARNWSTIHRQARELFSRSDSFEALAIAIASAGVELLSLGGVRADIHGHVAVRGSFPDRPPDGRSPTSKDGVVIEWWLNDEGVGDLGDLDEPIAAAIDARVELLAAVEAERDVGEHDALTGLLNRRGFLRRVAGLTGSFTVVLADVDRLKAINDAFGHDAGDRALCRVAGLLLEGRASDVVARWGGEEFVVVMPDTDVEGASAWLRRLIERGRDDGATPPVTFSAGVATCEPGADLDAAVKRADTAMYEAKNAGRATVVIA